MHGVTVRDRAAYLDAAATLVVADVHVGRDEASGVTFPLGERADLRDRLEALLSHFDPREVVFAGDVIHTFGGVSTAAESSLRELTSACRERGVRPVLVAGNHDTALRNAWEGDLHDEYLVTDPAGSTADGDEATSGSERTVVCHGHVRPETAADRYVIGHDHPAIEIEGVRHPCFLYGANAYRDADVWMLPAFNRLTPGVVVNGMTADELASPLVDDLDAFRPLVWDRDAQETLRFPPLGDLRQFL